MSRTTQLRMLGYVVTIALHVGNIVYMHFSLKQPHIINDPELKTFSRLQSRYFTCWTFFLQVVHAAAGLICDCLVISHSKKKTYKLLKSFKDVLFNAVVWPSTWVVFTVFWPLFLYDRKLIFPNFVDKVLTTTSNHIMHTAIIGVALWEVIFLPRTTPKSHKRNIFHLAFHLLLYLSVLVCTYIQYGVWIYPIFELFNGTVYFPLLVVIIGLVAIVYYYLQWPLTSFFWGKEMKDNKIR